MSGGGADPAQADDAEVAAPQPVERHRLGLAPRSAPGAQAGVQEVGSACQAQHQTNGGVGDVFRAVIGDVDDGNSPLAGGGTVHIVNADSAPDDEFALLQAAESLRAEAEEMIDHEAGGVLDAALELLLPF